MTRRTLTDATQANVLLKSRRRCCLCFWLKGEDEVKKGQLAHLDGDNANSLESNLAFLCLEHHDEYDSIPRLSKGLREKEVRRWRDELYKEMEYRFKSRSAGPLKVYFDPIRDCFWEVERICAVFRIRVRNEGNTTIKNVTVKVTAIECSASQPPIDLRPLEGQKLCLSQNPLGAYSHPDAVPEHSAILHPQDEVTFDFARLCAVPGNFLLCHSGFFPNPQTRRLDQKPNAYIPADTYSVIIRPQGDDVEPTSYRFCLSATTSDVFVEIES